MKRMTSFTLLGFCVAGIIGEYRSIERSKDRIELAKTLEAWAAATNEVADVEETNEVADVEDKNTNALLSEGVSAIGPAHGRATLAIQNELKAALTYSKALDAFCIKYSTGKECADKPNVAGKINELRAALNPK